MSSNLAGGIYFQIVSSSFLTARTVQGQQGQQKVNLSGRRSLCLRAFALVRQISESSPGSGTGLSILGRSRVNGHVPVFRQVRSREKRAFLAGFLQTGRITKAAELAGIHYSTHNNWLKQNEALR